MFQHKSPTKTLRRGTCPLGARLTGTGSASTCLGGLRLRCRCCRVTLQGRRRGEHGHTAPLLPQEQAAEPSPCSGCQGWEDLAVTLSLPRATGGHSPGGKRNIVPARQAARLAPPGHGNNTPPPAALLLKEK